MSHGDDRAGIVLQKAFEPGDRFRVEMVGRLVEQQQVGRPQEKPAQRDATPLATRQRGNVRVGRRKPQRVHRQFHARVEIPALCRLDAILDLPLLFEDLLHLLRRQILAEPGVDLVVLVQQRPCLRNPFLDVAQHVLRPVQPRFLRQEADADPVSRIRFAEEIVVLAGHDSEERALAGPVEAEHTDLRARQEREPDIFQNDMVGLVNLAQTFHGVDELRHFEPLILLQEVRRSGAF